MLLVRANRNDILGCLPAGAVAAEIGVAQGEYSEHLLTLLRPSKLHLIDPWRYLDVPDYATDANNTTDEEGDRRYKAVRRKFAPAIRDGTVQVHRALSTQIAASFPDAYFDFVHIDAVHTYSGCLADLRAFDRKVKRTGLITGHDYQTIGVARKDVNNVIQAVRDFVVETGYTFLALTFEEAPTYVLAKDADCPEVMSFIASLAKKHLVMAQIVNAEHKAFEQVEVPFAPQRYIFSFD